MPGRIKPELSFLQIWNMCFGFLGLQFGFALQNANVSRIFQTLGASLEQIPALWIAAPLTGLVVQPIIGYFSDRTWTRLGRRRPYFLTGALLASAALLAMPRSPALWIAAGLLWILDASINVSMEPFRAFVGDQLGPAQRPSGYAMQSFFIGLGAIVASMLPWLLARAGVSNVAAGAAGAASIPDTVRWSFDLGAAVLLFAVMWTVVRTREYPPEVLLSFSDALPAAVPEPLAEQRPSRRKGLLWIAVGIGGLVTIRFAALDAQLYLLAVGALVWGLALVAHGRTGGARANGSIVRGVKESGDAPHGAIAHDGSAHGANARGASGDRANSHSAGLFATVMSDLEHMPHAMRRLVPVQFFSWLALFSMWIYTTAAVAQVHFGSGDPHTIAYNEGANWVGVLFGAYNGFAALAAMIIPFMVRRFGLRASHLINLWLGGLALVSFLIIRNPHWLLLSMVGVGFAWASILSLPYALLSDSVPAEKMGIYMGIFNFFIVIPQLVAASVLGVTLKFLFGGAPIYALVLGGLSFMLAGLLALRVPQVRPKNTP
jgi:maltose/moltooligosaccharide transporter